MMHVALRDKLMLGTSRVVDSRGFLRAPAKFSRVGIQEYSARQLGLQDRDPEAIVRVYRPEAEVFKAESLASFASVPITDDHPPENVTAANWRRYSVGVTGHAISREGDHTVGEVLVTDADCVSKVQNGKVELSCGYGIDLELTAGTWNGQVYDAIARNINGNHVALVDVGRCGGSCRILDGVCQDCGKASDGEASCNCQGGDDMTGTPGAGPQLVQRVVDGLTIQVTEQGAQAIDKLTSQLADATKAKTEAEQKLTEAEAKHVKDLEAKDGEITGLKAQVSDTALDARATERVELIDKSRQVLGKDYDAAGKSNADIKKDVVVKVMGEDSVKDKSEDFINGLFGAVTDKKVIGDNADTVRTAVRDNSAQPKDTQVKDGGGDQPRGRDAYLARLRKGPDLASARAGA